MYVVACKWLGTDTLEYKLPSDFLESPDVTPEQYEWVLAAYAYASIIRSSEHYAGYTIIADPDSNDVISLTYYDTKEGYETLEVLPDTDIFLLARNTFLASTGLTLVEIKREIADSSLLTTPDYQIANALFTS